MALEPCIECGAKISTEAVRCPQCGKPLPTEVMRAEQQKAQTILWVIAGLSIVALLVFAVVISL